MLGAVLVDTAAADACLRLLRPEAFYREAHRRTWAAISRLRSRSVACDALTVADELQRAGHLEAVGGTEALTDWMTSVPTVANVLAHAELIVLAHARREAVAAAQRLAAAAGDPQQTIADLRAALRQAEVAITAAEAGPRGTVGMDELLMDAFNRAERVHDGERRPGLPTGLRVVDLALGGGLPAGAVVVLAGRPGEGKSSLAQQVASDVARAGHRTLLVSAEMPREDVGDRGMAHAAGVDSRRLRATPRLEDADWSRMAQAMGDSAEWGPRMRVETECGTAAQIEALARAEHARDPLGLVVIDHLHHLRTTGRSENREQELDHMVRGFAALARDLGCPVLLLAQLNRSAPGERREPRMHDLRGSGAIEQVAHVVALLHSETSAVPRQVLLIVDKSRNGVRGRFKLAFHPPTGRWRDAADA